MLITVFKYEKLSIFLIYMSYLKIAVEYLDNCKVKHLTWQKIMKNKKIPIDIKNYINGSRYIYMSEMIKKINKINCSCIHIYPTGSLQLTSDKDVQISININQCNSINMLFNIIKSINRVIKKANKDWSSKDAETLLDIHFYPPTILNFIDLNQRSYGTKYVRIANTLTHKTVIFVPRLGTSDLIKDFQKKEFERLDKKIKENTKRYYVKYNLDIAPCLYTIIECYKKKIKLSDQEFNDKLHCLVQYNNIGPEMYLTISSITMVVWHLQMGNKLSRKLLAVFAPVAYKENKMLYQRTKKSKYMDRYKYCQKYM
jgi:hypothetical protein